MKWLLLFLLISCGHKLTHYKSENFVKTWDYKFGPMSENQKDQFLDELKKVEEFYAEREILPRFDTYLSSIENEKELLAHAEFSMTDRFRKEKKRRAVESSREFQAYKEHHLKALAIKLKNEKEKRIMESIGEENYKDLLVILK